MILVFILKFLQSFSISMKF